MSLKKKKVLVGVSGGVDSSISLKLLKLKGYKVYALFLRIPIWNAEKNVFETNNKYIKKQENIARSIANKLDVPFYSKDLNKEFTNSVVNYFIEEYKQCKTPNPCAYCNRFFKIKYLFKFANQKNIDFVATGHYAKIKKDLFDNKYYLKRAKDKNKDQTYGLCYIKKDWLKRLIFPLGNLSKDKVYELSKKFGFNNFNKKEQSQDICFLKSSSLNAFLNKQITQKPGQIVSEKGHILGQHKGLNHYTIGQRKGLGLNKKYYVKDFLIKENKIIVSPNKNNITSKSIIVNNFNFLGSIKNQSTYLIQTRYLQKPKKGKVIILDKHKVKIEFNRPQKTITKGQFCVIYKKNICLGGGIISKKEGVF